MNTTLLQEPTAEVQAQIEFLLGDMKRLNVEMAQDRLEYNRLALETQKIAEESRRMMVQTQKILSELEAS